MDTILAIIAIPYFLLGYLFWIMVIGIIEPMSWLYWAIFLFLLWKLKNNQHIRWVKWNYYIGLCFLGIMFPLALYMLLDYFFR